MDTARELGSGYTVATVTLQLGVLGSSAVSLG